MKRRVLTLWAILPAFLCWSLPAHAEWVRRVTDGIMGTRITVELWASAGASDFTRPSLDDVDLESAIELRLPERAAAARALETHFAANWAAGAAYPRYAVESRADYWQYRLTEAAALAGY